jgi:hypothetical protein
MTRNEKEQVILEAVQLLRKNKGLKIKLNKTWVDSNFFNLELEYTIRNETKLQEFGFVAKWFDPNDFSMSWIRDLQVPANVSDYQKVLLKIAYYFYKWYKEKCQ